MNDTLRELMTLYRSAARKYALMEEYGSSPEDFEKQRQHCAALRREMDRLCPDSATYDPREFNIVAQV